MTGVANPYPGMNICNYGVETGVKCGGGSPLYVTETFVCGTSGGRTLCELALTNREVTVGGDSGGPWYVNQAAYGIHSGGDGVRSFFTMAGVLGGSYGLVIRQN